MAKAVLEIDLLKGDSLSTKVERLRKVSALVDRVTDSKILLPRPRVRIVAEFASQAERQALEQRFPDLVSKNQQSAGLYLNIGKRFDK